ncbi:amidase family protein [Rhodococcus opacus]|uniref:amidase family protein n=1 Tax=Rhodococcus opacus TaxID=37919 RepID=UPI0029533A15|nr:amidase family protein [Rhodococcus opacus]MDV7090509.1 amidase family protein [Rhodococcus opacus]
MDVPQSDHIVTDPAGRVPPARGDDTTQIPTPAPGVDTDTSIWRVVGDPLITAPGEGALSGCRIAVKDLFAVAGYAIGAGNPTWLDQAPIEPEHAAAVSLLTQEGADVAGIAQTDELACGLFGLNPHYGTPPNPAAPGRVPGGSSSGSASAVALGLADIGLGTDTAGSVRVPASYCGLYSLRPTHGIVSNAGRLALAPSFDTVGWITRTPQMLARVSEILLPRQHIQPIEQLLMATDLFDLAESSVRMPLQDAARQWANRMGMSLQTEASTFAEHLGTWVEAMGVVQAAEMWQVHGRWLQTHRDAVSPRVALAINTGESVPVDYLVWARDTLSQARITLTEVIPPGTALIHPAAPTAAPAPGPASSDLGVRAATVLLSCAASAAGQPVLTVPATQCADGPVGLSVIAAVGRDRALIAALTEHREISAPEPGRPSSATG